MTDKNPAEEMRAKIRESMRTGEPLNLAPGVPEGELDAMSGSRASPVGGALPKIMREMGQREPSHAEPADRTLLGISAPPPTDWRIAVIDKLPTFNMDWSPTVQKQWFKALDELMKRLWAEGKKSKSKRPKDPRLR